MRVFFLFLATVLTCGAATDKAVHFAPPAAWVEPIENLALPPTPAADVSYGYDYLVLDRQVKVSEQSVYWRSAYRITAEGSLQSGARLTWNYDPAYEQITLHHLRVIRGGETQERLKESLVKIIQRENDLDRHMLNGESTALVLLDDIRVGDVIDYAYTRTGWNPTFEGRYFDSLSTGWSIPVRRQHFRLITPAGRSILQRGHGQTAVAFETAKKDPDALLTWTASDVRPIEAESELPNWYIAYPYVQFSEFSNWAEVVKWAEPLYAVPESLPATIQEMAATLTRGLTNDSDKAGAILQFVQQEVRYLGMELGAGSYRPTQPSEVLARRFGDCKDKTLLFCALMRASGLMAYPALLNTDYRDKIEDWLPSPHAFDHVIACIPQNDGYAWVDPTLTYQKGDIGWRGIPDYRRALIVRPGMDRLTRMVVPEAARSSVKIEERFDVMAFDQPAGFHVTTHYTGRSADSMRRYFAQTTPEQIAKDYVNYYASVYLGTASVKPPTFAEDARRNVVTVEESYTVPNLWHDLAEGKKLKAEFYPKNISDLTTRPKTTVRAMPLGIDYPVNSKLTTTVNLPDDWTVKPGETVTENEAFRASEGISGEGRVVTMRYAWESRADHVPVERVAKYVEDLNRYRDSLGYNLTYTKPVPGAKEPAAVTPAPGYRLNWMLVLVAFVTVSVAALASVMIVRSGSTEPPLLVEVDQHLVGIGGWLVLVAIAVTLRPLLLLSQMAKIASPTFSQDIWDAITTPGNASYQPAFGPILVMEEVCNLLLLSGSVLMVVLFYRRHRHFPKTFIVLMAFSVVFLNLDDWAGTHVLKTTTSAETGFQNGGLQALLQALIWIPYMLISRRVKATFTR